MVLVFSSGIAVRSHENARLIDCDIELSDGSAVLADGNSLYMKSVTITGSTISIVMETHCPTYMEDVVVDGVVAQTIIASGTALEVVRGQFRNLSVDDNVMLVRTDDGFNMTDCVFENIGKVCVGWGLYTCMVAMVNCVAEHHDGLPFLLLLHDAQQLATTVL